MRMTTLSDHMERGGFTVLDEWEADGLNYLASIHPIMGSVHITQACPEEGEAATVSLFRDSALKLHVALSEYLRRTEVN